MQEETFKLQFELEDIPGLVESYRISEDENALDAGRKIRSGEYTREHLLQIFKWKTKGRGKSRIEFNSDADIADALRLAIIADTDRAAISVLLGLHGVDVPVASAILTSIFIDSDRYTVIDFRALEALGVKQKGKYRISPSLNYYIKYLHYCRKLAKNQNICLRTLDRALWQWSRDQSRTQTANCRVCVCPSS